MTLKIQVRIAIGFHLSEGGIYLKYAQEVQIDYKSLSILKTNMQTLTNIFIYYMPNISMSITCPLFIALGCRKSIFTSLGKYFA